MNDAMIHKNKNDPKKNRPIGARGGGDAAAHAAGLCRTGRTGLGCSKGEDFTTGRCDLPSGNWLIIMELMELWCFNAVYWEFLLI